MIVNAQVPVVASQATNNPLIHEALSSFFKLRIIDLSLNRTANGGAKKDGRSGIPHRDLEQIISEHPGGRTGTDNGSGSTLFFIHFIENWESRRFISADFCPLFDLEWVEHPIFFNNQINFALDFDGITILFDLFLVAAPVIGHTITISLC